MLPLKVTHSLPSKVKAWLEHDLRHFFGQGSASWPQILRHSQQIFFVVGQGSPTILEKNTKIGWIVVYEKSKHEQNPFDIAITYKKMRISSAWWKVGALEKPVSPMKRRALLANHFQWHPVTNHFVTYSANVRFFSQNVTIATGKPRYIISGCGARSRFLSPERDERANQSIEQAFKNIQQQASRLIGLVARPMNFRGANTARSATQLKYQTAVGHWRRGRQIVRWEKVATETKVLHSAQNHPRRNTHRMGNTPSPVRRHFGSRASSVQDTSGAVESSCVWGVLLLFLFRLAPQILVILCVLSRVLVCVGLPSHFVGICPLRWGQMGLSRNSTKSRCKKSSCGRVVGKSFSSQLQRTNVCSDCKTTNVWAWNRCRKCTTPMQAPVLQFHRHAIEHQTRCVPDNLVPHDSSSGDDGEDTITTYKEALAQEKKTPDTEQLVKMQDERIKTLEKMLQQGVKGEQSAGGQGDLVVEEEQNRKVVAATTCWRKRGKWSTHGNHSGSQSANPDGDSAYFRIMRKKE